MIQVCSRCSTRWNVRERQRVWCPRCNGTLLAPSDGSAASLDQRWSPGANAATPTRDGKVHELPAGYRWIAVRPGAAPAPRRAAVRLGPTPRYATIPRWGLQDHAHHAPEPAAAAAAAQSGPPVALVRAAFVLATTLFVLAALTHVLQYGLMLVNRGRLLNPYVANGAVLLNAVVSSLAVIAMIGAAVVATFWLVRRRARAYAWLDRPDPRSHFALFAGCLVPVVNLFFAPVYVIELALVEARARDLRAPITLWWCAWVASFLVCAWAQTMAIATLFRPDVQTIADDTLSTAVGYLLGAVAVLLLGKVFAGFESSPVDKPIKRWVIAGDPADSTAVATPVADQQAVREPAA